MDYELARFNMIEQQIRPWEVLDQKVLNRLSEIPREDFVPKSWRNLAFADINIPIGHDQVTMQPRVEARLLQSLSVSAEDRVLEIGTGCGYLTALLAGSAREVVSIDIFPDFTARAGGLFEDKGIHNVRLYTGDAINGWPEQGPYDVIVVTGSLPAGNPEIERQLTVGGRLFVILGSSPVMEAWLVTRIDENVWQRQSLFETDLPPLIGAREPGHFRF